MEMCNVKKNIIHILYKIYIFKNLGNSKTAENQSQKSEQVLGWYLKKWAFSTKLFH